MTMDGFDLLAPLLALAVVLLACFALLFFWLSRVRKPLKLNRLSHNPVLRPRPEVWWESEAVFNPAALVHDGRVHLFYRALGRDGISRIGHASSGDGIHFDERPNYPAYDPQSDSLGRARASRSNLKLSYATLTYDTVSYGSGGGWGGAEDPRAVLMDGMVHMTFTAFEGWHNERITLATLSLDNFDRRQWLWSPNVYLSAPGEVQKNWLLFPEKINGKYAVLHNIHPKIEIAYIDDFDAVESEGFIKSSFDRTSTPGRLGHWDALIRGAGAPPIKTEMGWLLLYHGMDPAKNTGYQVGAMLLDLHDPTKILYRSEEPVLKPEEWYENEWKAGVVYASGAVVFGDDLIVYYGGGDKYVAAAKANLRDFLRKLTTHRHAVLEPVRV
jgi:predicted GH43/DUF377 family glycosyl hydrolase